MVETISFPGKFKKPYFISSLLFLVLVPGLALAHQPRLVTEEVTTVIDPEISKAYYATPTGEPQVYRISASAPFDLYVNLLVPDIPGQETNVSALVIKDNDTSNPVAALDPASAKWERIFEPFGHDAYFMGPEYRARAAAGEYEIRVISPGNDSKYSLAIGELEVFGLKETVDTLRVIPELKRNFFNKSPADFILSPIGAAYVVVMFILAFAFGIIYRLILKRVAQGKPRGVAKNIGAKDRWLRLFIALVLFVLAIATTWSPLLLFFSGFTFFEAIFSWCGFYAALGKSTCPL